MKRLPSIELQEDVRRSVCSEVNSNRIINIPHLAEAIRKRNESENIAREDIERLLLTVAKQHGAIIVFDSMTPS
jgi:hypothetical protein